MDHFGGRTDGSGGGNGNRVVKKTGAENAVRSNRRREHFRSRLVAFMLYAAIFQSVKKQITYRLHDKMGQLRVHRLHLSVAVVEGADEAGLKLGAAHVLGTGYPVARSISWDMHRSATSFTLP